MAYSQEIIQIIADKIAVIPTTATLVSVPTFYTNEMWDFNQLTDAVPPYIILDRPLLESSKILVQGNPEKSYKIRLYIFAGFIEVNADHATYKEPLLILAEEIKSAILKLFIPGFLLSGIGKVNVLSGYNSTEIPESVMLDSNPVGLMLELPIVFTSLKSLC